MRRIDELHLAHPFMGARMLRDQLARQGIQAGRRHVTALMQRMGSAALAPQPGTSKGAPGHKIYPYLLRTLPITRANRANRANRVWALDTTHIPMAHRLRILHGRGGRGEPPRVGASAGHYAGGDPCQGGDRAGLGPSTAHPGSSTPARAASSRLKSSPPSCWPRAADCRQSMDGRGAWRDNVFVERLRRSVKYERIYPEGLRLRQRGPRRHRRLPRLVQHTSLSVQSGAAHARWSGLRRLGAIENGRVR